MQNHAQLLFRALALPVLLLTLNSQPSTAHAQGTAFTYQGRLNSSGAPANGSYDVQFTLYNTNVTGLALAGPVTNTAVNVTNGLFTTLVNFGPDIFTGTNYWLELAVSTNAADAFSTLAPRQELTPVPYAIFANGASNLLGTLSTAQLTGGIAASQLVGTIPSANISGTYGNAVDFNNGANVFDGTFFGQFLGNSFIGGSFSGQFVGDGSGLININPAHIAGEVAYLNSNQVFTAQNDFLQGIGIGTPNPSPIFGLDILANQGQARMTSTNAGNGSVLELRNLSTYNYEYIGAINFNNLSNSYAGQIGYFAANPTNINNDYLQIRVGGAPGALTLQADPSGGGVSSLIGGTLWNYVDQTSGRDVIAGGGRPGYGNVVYSNSFGDFIGAGSGNQIGPNVDDSVIAGAYNTVQSWDSVVGGGSGNVIQPVADHATIAGGYNNSIQTNSWDSAIGGGYGNVIQPFAAYSVIGGGNYNLIQTNMPYSFIGGGDYNSINYVLTNPPVGYVGFAGVAGGFENQANGMFSFVGGGLYNTASGIGSAILGGNVYQYVATNGTVSYFGPTVASGLSSTVVGGAGNQAHGDFSLAAGCLALANHSGSFVWADSQYAYFSSTTSNEFSIRAQNGVHIQADKGIHLNAANEPVIVRDWDVFATNAPAAKAGIGRWGLFVEPFNLTLGIPDTNVGDSYPRYFQVAKYATNGSYTPLMWVDQSGDVTAAGSITAGSVNGYGGGLTGLNASQLTFGTIPPWVFSGNYYNVIFMTNAGNIFAGNGSGLTGLNASQLTSGIVPAGVFAGNYTNAVTMTNPANVFVGNGSGLTGLNASQLTGGTVPASVFAGNYTNAVMMTNPGNIFAGNGAGLTNVNAALLDGLSATNFIINQSLGIQNASFQISGNGSVGGSMSASTLIASNAQLSGTAKAASLIVSNAQATGLFRSGSETGTSDPPSPAGLVIRRVNSLSATAGNVIARTDVLTLERDGSNEGLLIRYPASVGPQTINCVAQSFYGTNIIVHATVNNPLAAGTIQLVTSAQRAVRAEVSFGNTRFQGHVTQVVIDRYDDGSINDNYWVGTLTSTYNQ